MDGGSRFQGKDQRETGKMQCGERKNQPRQNDSTRNSNLGDTFQRHSRTVSIHQEGVSKDILYSGESGLSFMSILLSKPI